LNFSVSGNERKGNYSKNCKKGHNETLEIANSLEQTRVANEAIRGHVPENRGTWITFCDLSISVLLGSKLHFDEHYIIAKNSSLAILNLQNWGRMTNALPLTQCNRHKASNRSQQAHQLFVNHTV